MGQDPSPADAAYMEHRLPDDAVQHVVDHANRMVPKRVGTEDMSDTLQYAQDWLTEHNFRRVQLDRWDHERGVSIELGFAHGEVWFRGWKRQAKEAWPVTKIKTQTTYPGDLQPLHLLISQGLETEPESL